MNSHNNLKSIIILFINFFTMMIISHKNSMERSHLKYENVLSL